MLEQMNTTVTSVSQMIETTQTLSSQLMLGADRLETAGRQLTLASSAFNQENENYLSANRETTQQLQGTLVQSRELLNDFAATLPNDRCWLAQHICGNSARFDRVCYNLPYVQ